MTQSDLARKHGVSKQAVNKRVKQLGSIAAADEALSQSINLNVTGAADYKAERALLTKAQREKAEMDLAERKGELVEAKQVLAELARNVARVRAMLDSAFISELPARQGGLPSDQIAQMNGERLKEIYAELSKPLC